MNDTMKKYFIKAKLTRLTSFKKKATQQGFTLLELMVTMAIGVVLFAGVLSIFVGMQTTVKETSAYGELQENGRFAISVLTNDLLQQSFFGDYAGTLNFSTLIAIPNPPAVECTGGGANNGTYPVGVGHFRTLWGETSTAAGTVNMSCINDAAPNSDVIQLKRVISNDLPALPTPPTNFSYFVSNSETAALYTVPLAGVAPVISNSRTWQYQHHIYYVQDGFPVLMQWRLTSQMTVQPIIEGIERIYFMYGVSTVTDPTQPGYGVVNAYVSASNMAQALWDNNNSRILAVKIYVLARSILPDLTYTDDKTYKLGDQADYKPNDNFRRLLLSSTVTLFNSEKDSWQ